jgi:SAM-dependent methyltransferase
MKSPDYSSYAKQYAQSRPTYPEALFDYLASLVEKHNLAWDCATGNGQAALALARHFKKIIATDISAEQIKHAIQHQQIEYRVATSEQSDLDDKSIDLVTVASALHWFDLDRFYAEVRRVVRPGGVLAAWSYHVGYMEAPFDKIFLHFYQDILFDYFAPGARLVDDRYENITLPGEAIDGGQFYVTAHWNHDQMLGFIKSWSGTQQYLEEKSEDPANLIADDLRKIWGNPQKTHILRWPLFVKVSRL